MNRPYHTPQILIAEDDPDDQVMLQEAFEESCPACVLSFVSDGVELMARLQQPDVSARVPDLLLLDLNMPLKDGRQALQEIRNLPGLHQLPVVILTTSKNDEDRAFCLARGANDYLVKPASYTELINIVQSLATWWAPG
ncbi:MAG TPA: response regulator [Marinobacter sp.]|nr:response regulator [Marinobacter sp.]